MAKTAIVCIGVGEGGRAGVPCSVWIFIHYTNKVEGSLIVLFFGLVYIRCPLSWKIFCRRP